MLSQIEIRSLLGNSELGPVLDVVRDQIPEKIAYRMAEIRQANLNGASAATIAAIRSRPALGVEIRTLAPASRQARFNLSREQRSAAPATQLIARNIARLEAELDNDVIARRRELLNSILS